MTILLFLRWAIKASLWMQVKSQSPPFFQRLDKWMPVTILLRFTVKDSVKVIPGEHTDRYSLEFEEKFAALKKLIDPFI